MVMPPGTRDGEGSPAQDPDLPPSDDSPYRSHRVVWAGGRRARDLAGALSDDGAIKAGSNLAASCVESKASLLVLSNRTSFDLCSVAVPHGFDRDATRSIVAAVGGGPHSFLAAVLADWLSQRLSVPACAVYGYSDPSELFTAEDVLNKTAARVPRLDVRAVVASDPAAMVGALPAGTLLIVGAPGGSWFQRRFFGPGARIHAKAPSGTIVVNHNPARVYQVMQPPVAYGPHMRVSDALQLSEDLDVVVAEHGELLGTVRADTLRSAGRDLELREVMDSDVFLSADDEISEAVDLVASYSGGLFPVVDNQARLVGCVSAADLSIRPLV